jgi:hypothetical protein
VKEVINAPSRIGPIELNAGPLPSRTSFLLLWTRLRPLELPVARLQDDGRVFEMGDSEGLKAEIGLELLITHLVDHLPLDLKGGYILLHVPRIAGSRAGTPG